MLGLPPLGQRSARVRARRRASDRRSAVLSEIDLWDGAPPGTEHWTHDEVGPAPFAEGVTIVRNVVRPTLTQVSDGATGVIVAPGGAYHFLAVEHEGFAVARWLGERGHAAYVLKYRVQPTPAADGEFHAALASLFAGDDRDRWRRDLAPLFADGAQAVRRVRERHERVAMIGFSAGALLTVRTLQSDAPPDAAALIYPPLVDDVEAAPSDAPPIFVAMAADDPLTTGGATHLDEIWRAAGRSSELHLFEQGGHGFGMNPQGLPVDRWIDLLGDWLASHDLG